MKINLLQAVINVMKILSYGLLVQIFFMSIVYAHKGNAQNKSVQEVLLPQAIKGITIKEAFELIESNSDFRLFYFNRYLNQKSRITLIPESGRSIYDLLLEISKQSSLKFQQVNNMISVSPIPKDELKLGLNPVAILKDVEISGKILDENGQGLPGASLIIKGTRIGTITDVDGNYNFTVPEYATIVVSFVGYEKQEVVIGTQTVIEIKMVPDASQLDEVVVVGYGTQERANLTGSISSLNSGLMDGLPDLTFENKLAGQLSGVNILQTTGTPGGNVSIRIRGISSITGGNEPLIVIDGFPISDGQNTSAVQGSRPGNSTRQENPQNPLATLNPSDIESVQVLKDAAAAAIYGSRGSNGVILITTKRGVEGKATFDFNAYRGIQQITKTYDMMDAYQFAEQNFIARKNGGSLAGYLDEWYPYLNDEPGLTNTDWQDEIFRTATIENYDLSVRGGQKKAQYYVSGNFSNQDGIIIGSGFNRYSLRANLDAELSKNVNFGVNFNPSFSVSDLVPSENPYFVDGIVNIALLSIPTETVYNPDGSYNFNQNTASGSGPFVNPVAIANGIDDELKQTRLLSGAFLEATVFEKIKLRTQLGMDIGNWRRSYYRPSWLPVRGTPAPSNPSARNFSTQTINWISENTATYQDEIGEGHNLTVLLGYTIQKDLRERSGLFATDFPNDFVQTLNAGEITSGFSDKSEWSLLSYLSRVNYDYKGRYLVSASLRRDGASRFGKNTKWGYFPSVSVGWRLSDMSFFDVGFVSDLKLRGSYGLTGNFSIPNYGAIALVESADYVLNDTKVNGIAPDTSPNADLSWEKNSASNFGLDLGLFDDKLTFSAEYYISTTKDLLMNLPIPSTSGFRTSLQNIGKIENKGLELSVTSKVTVGDWKITTNANIATNENRVLSAGNNDEPILSNGGVSGTHITQVGSPVGSYYGYNVLGVFTTQNQLDEFPHQSDAQLGDFIFEDVNSDGTISPDDRTIIGDFFPDYTFGLTSQVSYKNFDLNVVVQGKQNFEVLHLAQRYLGSLQTFSNYRADIFENAYISESNPGNGQVYRPNSSPTNDNDAISSYHIEDGSYVRIRNITLGYTFPQELTDKMKLQRLRVYLTSSNPFTFTNYSGYNPEVNQRPANALSQGEDYGTYPVARTFIAGINISF